MGHPVLSEVRKVSEMGPRAPAQVARREPGADLPPSSTETARADPLIPHPRGPAAHQRDRDIKRGSHLKLRCVA
eukprot:5560289-Pyramimonas_sp.AAC.1